MRWGALGRSLNLSVLRRHDESEAALIAGNKAKARGRAVLVTGASRGIGAAVARAFAATGDRVALHYRSGRAAAEETLASLPGERHVMLAADLTWCAVRHMLARSGGRVVNVSSRGAFRGEPNHLAYGASKAALNAFGQSLARALA